MRQNIGDEIDEMSIEKCISVKEMLINLEEEKI